ncbi:hypothetical protein Ancab_027652 [Ancistrocladus abbreviatus]
MTDRIVSSGIQDMGVTILKETLHEQQELLQQLYTELDVEREAAATATSEALSTMLRLQGEKAAVEMEASQYKRIAEEKLSHAEEAIAIFRELIYQKEMQIASLEFQVQAYRFKLLSLGCNDLGVSETQYPENMLVQSNERTGDVGVRRHLRRGSSLPPIFPKNGESRNIREKSAEDSPKVLEEIKEQDSFTEKRLDNSTHGDFNLYWEQIKKLDERVKELSRASSPHDPAREEFPAKLGFEASDDSAGPAKVQDIFEVPQIPASHQGGAVHRKEKRKLCQEAENGYGKPDQVSQEVANLGTDKSSWAKTPLLSPDSDNKLPKPKEVLNFEHQFYFQRPGVADFEFQQLNRRLKSLEDERITTRQEISARHELSVELGEEDLRLLKEIKEQLNSIQDEIMSWRSEKAPPLQQPYLNSLMEAMMHFWL